MNNKLVELFNKLKEYEKRKENIKTSEKIVNYFSPRKERINEVLSRKLKKK